MCGCGAGGGGGEADTICVGDVTSDVEEVTDDVRRIGGFGRFPLLPPEVTYVYSDEPISLVNYICFLLCWVISV